MNGEIQICSNVKTGDYYSDGQCDQCLRGQKDSLKIDSVKEHTLKKVELVATYTEKWLEKGVYTGKFNQMNFIDAMANAGYYTTDRRNEEKHDTTSIKVFKLFQKFAQTDSGKKVTFNLYINDISKSRIEHLKSCIEACSMNLINVNVYYHLMDVNCFLDFYLCTYNKYNLNIKPLTLIYVDPYNYAMVDNAKLIKLMNRTYSELIFNYMKMDVQKNIKNETAKNKRKQIKKSIDDLGYTNSFNEIERDTDLLLQMILERFKDTKFKKYNIPFEFRTSTNVTIYYLIFFAHNYEGLKLYRDATWEVFKGDAYFRNTRNKSQLSFDFSDSNEENNIREYTKIAINLIKKKYPKEFKTDDEFYTFVITNVPLMDKHIVSYIIRPLLKNKRISKKNKTKKIKDVEYKWEENLNESE